MGLSPTELDELLRLVSLTADREVDCDECLNLVAEFAEHNLTGKSLPEGLAVVEQHLAVCAECRAEYEALRRVLVDQEPNA